MMDDFRPARRPLPRRDFSDPARPVQSPMQPQDPPVHQPAPVQPAAIQATPITEVHQPAAPVPAPARQPAHYPQTQHHTAAQSQKNLRRRYMAIGLLLILAAAIFTGGYIFKSKTPDKTLPAAVVTRAKYDVYFPSPMPADYIYVDKTATFQIGDVFYRFADGLKSVTVREEPLPANKPNLNLYKGYTLFSTGVGQAAMGSSFGQPVAVIVTPTTVITMNASGGVAPKDLKTAIDNLHNIGSSSQGVSNG